MEILADESVDSDIVARLRKDGYKDFGELIFRQGYVKRGIVLYRLAGVSAREKAEIVSQVIIEHGVELLEAFSVITEKTVRIRKI